MNPILFGRNDESRIVAVNHVADNVMRVYRRSAESLETTEHEFYPFFLLSDSSYLEGFSEKRWIKQLEGDHYFQYICAFARWSEMWDAVNHILQNYNSRSPTKVDSYADLPIIHLRSDPVSQFLIQTGRTLFKGMVFDELNRIQVDIETYTKPGQRFSNPNRRDDRIILIALSDNRGWEHLIDGHKSSEPEMLHELASVIQERDPDVIEGHNILSFDLPYILRRCELHGIDLVFGRDGTPTRSVESRTVFAERPFDYQMLEIGGRHVVDTLQLVQHYDSSKRILESYGLKYVAQHFGLAKADRVYVPGNRIVWFWENEPDTLAHYALDDVRESRALSDLLSPAYFHLAQMVPFNFGTVTRMGASAKIESLLLREYIHRKHSVPKPEALTPTGGGYTQMFYSGVLGPVVDVDVESLYPSLMLNEQIQPRSEHLGIFRGILEEMTRRRIDAKRKTRVTTDTTERTRLDALQSSFKILINSFYGYLGYHRALFNDFQAANRVTQSGQRILRHLIDEIASQGGKVVAVDTDGIFFVPPSTVVDESSEEHFVNLISQELPRGIVLALKGRYRAMLSYKKKNYALLTHEGTVKVKGSSLSSRTIERFGRRYIQQCIEKLLHHDVDALHTLYVTTRKLVSERQVGIEDLARTETLKDSIEEYLSAVESGRRNRMACYEVAMEAGLRWKPGDQVSYYITGIGGTAKGFENCKLVEDWDPNFPDENIPYYLRRLDEFSRKFEVFFKPSDFRSIFSMDDLFPFSPEGIELVTAASDATTPPDDLSEESAVIEPTIWLERG